jgi:hypothetical protein
MLNRLAQGVPRFNFSTWEGPFASQAKGMLSLDLFPDEDFPAVLN